MIEMKIIAKADRTSAESKYVDEGYIVEYDGVFYFVDTEGEELTDDELWFSVERNYVFDEIEDGYSYWINGKRVKAAELLGREDV